MHALHMIEFEFLALFLAINISYGRDENNKLSAALFRQYYPIYSVRKRNSFAIFLYQRFKALAPARGRSARPCRSDERTLAKSAEERELRHSITA